MKDKSKERERHGCDRIRFLQAEAACDGRTFENLFKALEIEQARQELNRLELEAHEDGFWNDLERSQKNQMRSKQLQIKFTVTKSSFPRATICSR